MNDQQLRQFICVAKHKNITQAARELFMTQQALSQSIQHLEKDMGVKLFIRTLRGVELTDVAKRIYSQCELMLEQLDQFKKFVDEQIHQDTINATIVVQHQNLMLSIPAEIAVEAIEKHIVFYIESNFYDCVDALRDDRCAAVYCFKPRCFIGANYIPVIRESPVVLLSDKNPLANKSFLTIDDIKDENILLPDSNTHFKSDVVKAFSRFGCYPKIVYEPPSIALIMNLVRANSGVKLSPPFALPNYDMRNIRVLPLETDDVSIEAGFLIKEDFESLRLNEQQLVQSMLTFYGRELQLLPY